jgi:MFS family permease
MLTLAIASIGSGSSTTVLSLLVWRVIQAFGSASGMSVGIAVLADIYKMEERGTASGAFFGVSTYNSLS